MAQLRAFVEVARHGSVKRAARALGISEPAVSEAVASLRRQLGEELYVRAGRGIALTPGGDRLAGIAEEMLGLAEEAEHAVRETGSGSRRLRVAVTRTVAEHAIAPLLDAFAERTPELEVSVEEAPAGDFAALLARRRVDIALGPRPGRDGEAGTTAVPFLRCRLIVIAGRDHRLAAEADVPPSALARERWLVGTTWFDAVSPTRRYLARAGLAPADVGAYTSDAAAASAVAAGEGVMLTVAHAVLDELRRRTLVRLDVRGTPLTDLWYATTLDPERCTPAAIALRRFATTPEATAAMSATRSGVAATHARAPVHTTLWSSVPRASAGLRSPG